jgi:hypothetical protein
MTSTGISRAWLEKVGGKMRCLNTRNLLGALALLLALGGGRAHAQVTSVGLGVPASSIFGVTGSPVTSSGALVLTTTGTSGGLPYFSSASQMSSSGLLTGLVLGNGGVAAVSHRFLTALSPAGVGTLAQPLTSDLSDIGIFSLNTSGTIATTNTTASTSPTTGAVVVAGGLGVGGGIWVGAGDFLSIGGALSFPTNMITGVHLAPNTAQRVEIQKRAIPLDYSGTDAGFVLQQTDTGNLATNTIVPQAVFDMASTGNGVVFPSTHISTSVWMGALGTMTKSGDGSGSVFTAIGITDATAAPSGSTGYNEAGGFQGTMVNRASVNSTLSGVEIQLTDSPDLGFTKPGPTQLSFANCRLQKWNTDRTRWSTCLHASSEGSVAPDSIIQTDATSSTFVRGIDLSKATFTGGAAFLIGNGTPFYGAMNAAGTLPLAGMFLDNTDTWRFGFGGYTAKFDSHVSVEGVTSTGATGTGKVVFDTSPTLATPSIAYEQITNTCNNPATTCTATCSAGKKVVGGGANTTGSVVGLATSYPSAKNAWTASYLSSPVTAINVIVVCTGVQ